jgi:hypothetical protein
LDFLNKAFVFRRRSKRVYTFLNKAFFGERMKAFVFRRRSKRGIPSPREKEGGEESIAVGIDFD